MNNTTINKWLNLIRVIFDYGIKNNLIDYKLKFHFNKLKETNIIRHKINKDDLIKIFSAVRVVFQDEYLSKRNELIILLLLETGVRRTELANIKIKNFCMEKRTLTLTQTKNNQIRVIWLSSCFCKQYVHYLKFIKAYYTLSDNDYLFFNKKGDKCTPTTISYILRKLNKYLGLDYSISSHIWRRTNASHLIQECKDLLFVSKQLGHSTVEVTKKYIIYDDLYQLKQKEKHSPIKLVKG